jgi:ASC-1-like (ASCH) protein
MQTHQLQLATQPFEAIKNGTKTIECRLYDEKRQLIGIGDELVFTNRENPEQKLQVKVRGLLRYNSFEDLFSVCEASKFGGETTEGLIDQIRQFYSVEEESKYGVLGIHICLV